MKDLSLINGNEIIDFLNSLSNDELCDISCRGPYVFENQKIEDGKYLLSFSAYYNNWGTDQFIEDNVLVITNNKVRFQLNEPFDSDESEVVLCKLVDNWLKTHEFSTTYVERFNSLILESYESLAECQYGDDQILDDVIKKLTIAKTLIK